MYTGTILIWVSAILLILGAIICNSDTELGGCLFGIGFLGLLITWMCWDLIHPKTEYFGVITDIVSDKVYVVDYDRKIRAEGYGDPFQIGDTIYQSVKTKSFKLLGPGDRVIRSPLEKAPTTNRSYAPELEGF